MNLDEFKNKIKINLYDIEWSSLCIKDCTLATNQIIMDSEYEQRRDLELKNNIRFLQKHFVLLQTYSERLVEMLCIECSRQIFQPVTHWNLGMIAYVAGGISKVLEQYLQYIYEQDKYKTEKFYHSLQIESDSINYLYTKLTEVFSVLRRENLI